MRLVSIGCVGGFFVYVAGGITRPFISPTLSPGKPKFSTNTGVGVVFLIVLVGAVLFNIMTVI